MQGAGNDYIYVNTLLYNVADPKAAAIAWSDRHFGIGSDGLVLIGATSDPAIADFSMRIFNADGSEAMMCGNASRCIGKYVYEKGLTDKTEIRLETLSGVKVLKLSLSPLPLSRGEGSDMLKRPDAVESVTVDMGEPKFDMPEQYAGGRTDGVFVSMGNPHFVKFVDNIKDVDVAAEGSKLEYDKAFPQRCNIEFAQLVDVLFPNHKSQTSNLKPQSFRTRVWERGSGITMACGTGACATAVAAAKVGLAGRRSDIVMDGGTLHIEWSEQDNHVYMTGPAEFVFEGEIKQQ